jgi:hypothetical protein
MRPAERLLHEVIIRALQMVLNAWQRYLKDQTQISNDDSPAQ